MPYPNIRFLPRLVAVTLVVLFLMISHGFADSGDNILIVQDELPALKVLTGFLAEKGKLGVTVVDQPHLPQDLSGYKAVLAYIHKQLDESVELAVIGYTQQGGRFIALHHSISSGKAKNRYYFDFLGIQLDHPKQSKHPVEPGQGYGWVSGEDVTLTLVNLNPHHYITNHNITWGDPIAYLSSDQPSVEGHSPSISLPDSEVYMNHKFIDGREKTVLCGFKFMDKRNNRLFMQDRAVWLKTSGNGDIVYIMPGHTPSDYENQNVSQMILNAIQWTS
jgi:hypothetical protein